MFPDILQDLFGYFWSFLKTLPNMDPRTPYLLQTYFKKYKINMDAFYENLIYVGVGFLNFEIVETYVHQSFLFFVNWCVRDSALRTLRFWIFEIVKLRNVETFEFWLPEVWSFAIVNHFWNVGKAEPEQLWRSS